MWIHDLYKGCCFRMSLISGWWTWLSDPFPFRCSLSSTSCWWIICQQPRGWQVENMGAKKNTQLSFREFLQFQGNPGPWSMQIQCRKKNRSISLCNHHDTALMEMWYFYISTWHQRLPFPDTLVACLEMPWFNDVLSQNLCMITYDYMPMGLHILSVWSWAARECNYTKMQCMCW